MKHICILTCLLLIISTRAIPVSNHLRFAKRAIGDSCGSGGVCKDENECEGVTKSGLCPHDAANIKCCLPPNTCTLSSGQSGVCIERSHCTASGKTPESGRCPHDGASECTMRQKQRGFSWKLRVDFESWLDSNISGIVVLKGIATAITATSLLTREGAIMEEEKHWI